MKLSEAIKLGAMLKPQAFGQGGPGKASCALRAAAEARGIPDVIDHFVKGPPMLNYIGLEDEWPILREKQVCPVCNLGAQGYVVVYHLNDYHRWNREQIADWVATIEPQEPSESTNLETPLSESVSA